MRECARHRRDRGGGLDALKREANRDPTTHDHDRFRWRPRGVAAAAVANLLGVIDVVYVNVLSLLVLLLGLLFIAAVGVARAVRAETRGAA